MHRNSVPITATHQNLNLYRLAQRNTQQNKHLAPRHCRFLRRPFFCFSFAILVGGNVLFGGLSPEWGIRSGRWRLRRRLFRKDLCRRIEHDGHRASSRHIAIIVFCGHRGRRRSAEAGGPGQRPRQRVARRQRRVAPFRDAAPQWRRAGRRSSILRAGGRHLRGGRRMGGRRDCLREASQHGPGRQGAAASNNLNQKKRTATKSNNARIIGYIHA